MSNNKFDRFYYSILCSVIGDIIGYGNSKIEFNRGYNKQINTRKDVRRMAGVSNYHVVNFIKDGGLSGFNPKKFIVSDDTILMLSVLLALTKSYNQSNDVILETIKKGMIHLVLNDDRKQDRNYGGRTEKSLTRIYNGHDWKKWGYSEHAGGNGASMRNMPIGLIYHGKKNREKLIYLAIMSSRITHNNAIGYVGGLASALFSALAIEDVDPNTYMFELLEILKSDYFKSVIDEITKDFPKDKDKHWRDIKQCIDWINIYIEDRFNEKKRFVSISTPNQMEAKYLRYFDNRSQYYYDNFTKKEFKDTLNPGSNGMDAVILAYDAFMDSKSFESLVYYSMLHVGDSDTTGCIAGAFYGAFHSTRVNTVFDHTQIDKYDWIKELTENAKHIFK